MEDIINSMFSTPETLFDEVSYLNFTETNTKFDIPDNKYTREIDISGFKPDINIRENTEYEKTIIVNTIKFYLENGKSAKFIKSENDRVNFRTKNVISLYQYLIQNIGFLKSNKEFRDISKQKALEFIYEIKDKDNPIDLIYELYFTLMCLMKIIKLIEDKN